MNKIKTIIVFQKIKKLPWYIKILYKLCYHNIIMKKCKSVFLNIEYSIRGLYDNIDNLVSDYENGELNDIGANEELVVFEHFDYSNQNFSGEYTLQEYINIHKNKDN